MAHTHAPAPSTSVNPAAHQRRLIATLTVTGVRYCVLGRIAILRQRSCFVAVVAYFVFERQY